MSNKKQGEVVVFRRAVSNTTSMETVVALAQQRQSALGHRLNEIGSIQQQLEQWESDKALFPSQEITPK